MLRLRQEQLDEIAAKRRQPFLLELETYVKKRYPESTWNQPSDRIKADLEDSIQQAFGFDIAIEDDVALFVDFTYQLDQHCYIKEDFEWARQILIDPDLSGTEKVERIFNIVHGLGDDADGEDVESDGDEDDEMT